MNKLFFGHGVVGSLEKIMVDGVDVIEDIERIDDEFLSSAYNPTIEGLIVIGCAAGAELGKKRIEELKAHLSDLRAGRAEPEVEEGGFVAGPECIEFRIEDAEQLVAFCEERMRKPQR